MRTTLTLDPDVALLVRRRLKQQRGSLKQVINDGLRKGLNQAAAKKAPPFRVEPHSFQFKPGVDLNKLNQLADELEVEEFRRKHSR